MPFDNLARALALSMTCAVSAAQEGVQSLFDGESLAGWEVRAGEEEWWTVADGALTGGSLERDVPFNTFLATEASFHNFELRLKIRIRSAGGFANSGIQIRSRRVSGSHEMIGYQVDAGDGWWGKLYDESRRNRVLAEAADLDAVAASIRPGDWNDYRILAEGRRLRTWINDVPALDYTEPDGDVPLDGVFGVQVHSGGKVQVQVKDVTLERLPATPGAMTWRTLDKRAQVAAQGSAPPLTAAEEQAGFELAPGFTVELVAADPDMDKVVDIAFDDSGRLWAITAREYPIDGNEDPRAAELYRRGGRDQVLVFDDVYGPGPHRPRVFADGLVIPLALLPEGDSVLVGQGPEVMRLHDDDGDGRADRREVLLTGFGIEDSHLMPHRFVRAPGGWIYLAQGAFNSSEVVTTNGDRVTFNKCKVGRFRPDGSAFEVVGVGLNNIWGFVLDRHGSKWIQEANDLGYPLAPFEHGASYPGIGSERYHPAAVWQPPRADFRMGGTGLSGLALSEDRGGLPAPWDTRFVLANPILSALQTIDVVVPEESPSELVLRRGPDLLTSEDPNFRPIAAYFGPDGCLYVVDWYNPIISHNEVPRDHPSRDKVRSRIWRVRHETQRAERPLDVAAAPTASLVGLLDADSTWASRAAWHQIVARGAVELVGDLRALALDGAARVEARLLAAWSLDELGRADGELVERLLASGSYALRREGARLCGGLEAGAGDVVRWLEPFTRERDPRVRLAAIESLRARPDRGPETARLLLAFLRPALDEPTVRLAQWDEAVPTGVAGEVAFERSMLRVALEEHAAWLPTVLAAGAGDGLSEDARTFAALCLGGEAGAAWVLATLESAGRAPTRDELLLLGRHGRAADVQRVVAGWLSDPAARVAGLELVLETHAQWDTATVAAPVVASVQALLAEDATAHADLALRVARTLRLAALEGEVVHLLDAGGADRLECLRALVEIGCRDVDLLYDLAATSVPGSEFRRLAATALASVQDEYAFESLVELWPNFGTATRRAALDALLARREGAERLVAAVEAGDIEARGLDRAAWRRLTGHLGEDHAGLAALRERTAADELTVLWLGGGRDDYVDTDLELAGPFTVEAWVRLAPEISNADGLLAAPGSFDLNFHAGVPRLWVADAGDVIVAGRAVEAGAWFHLALTRDAAGELRLYLNGELDTTSARETPERFEGLDVGRTNPGVGTAGELAQVRVWNVARSAVQIGEGFRCATDPGADGLVFHGPGGGGDLALLGAARVDGVLDGPTLQSAEEARAESARFDAYRALAGMPGDLARGREVFVAHCGACHRVAGEGTSIGPVLDGVGGKGVEGLLRSILTPNAGVESGYRTLIVRTRDGELLDGFLAAEDEHSITLRRKDREDLRLLRTDLESLRFDRLSLMPEGLLEPLSEDEVRDLFAYLQSLK